MIAANEAVAGLLSERGTPCLYRVHERPEPERVKRLVEQLSSLEVPTPPVPKSMSPSQAAELMGEISRRVEAHVRRQRPRARGADLALLRALQQAAYSPKNSVTPAWARPATAISPRRSAATPTSSATARCCPRSAPESARRGRRAGGAGPSGPPTRAGGDDDRARRRRRRALLRARAGALRARLGATSRRGGGPDLGRGVHRLRRRTDEIAQRAGRSD